MKVRINLGDFARGVDINEDQISWFFRAHLEKDFSADFDLCLRHDFDVDARRIIQLHLNRRSATINL
jgi:hypothetical protein